MGKGAGANKGQSRDERDCRCGIIWEDAWERERGGEKRSRKKDREGTSEREGCVREGEREGRR